MSPFEVVNSYARNYPGIAREINLADNQLGEVGGQVCLCVFVSQINLCHIYNIYYNVKTALQICASGPGIRTVPEPVAGARLPLHPIP